MRLVLLAVILHASYVCAYRPSGISRQQRSKLGLKAISRWPNSAPAQNASAASAAGQLLEVARFALHGNPPAGIIGEQAASVAAAGGEPFDAAVTVPHEAVNTMNLSEKSRALIASREGAFDALDKENITFENWLYAVGGGTGATIGSTGNNSLDVDLVRRMRYQDEAVLLLLMSTYLLILGLSAYFTYREVYNSSRVTYYADPRLSSCAIESHALEDFLESFNQPPKDCMLEVAGFIRTQTPDSMHGHVVEWHDGYYYVAFAFSLDLSTWVQKAVGTDSRKLRDVIVDGDGVAVADKGELRDFLEKNRNDMATVEVLKVVSWQNFEELATNIRAQLRQSGFGGTVSINRTEEETLTVYKNKQWANFMHYRTLKILCALSVLGWLLYIPYMFFRCTRKVVRTFHVVDISIDDYWPWVAQHLNESGFAGSSLPHPAGNHPMPTNGLPGLRLPPSAPPPAPRTPGSFMSVRDN